MVYNLIIETERSPLPRKENEMTSTLQKILEIQNNPNSNVAVAKDESNKLFRRHCDKKGFRADYEIAFPLVRSNRARVGDVIEIHDGKGADGITTTYEVSLLDGYPSLQLKD